MGDIRVFEQAIAYCEHELTEILTTEQLARLIHKSPASIRSDASRNPRSLPPICRLPGSKRLLWRLIDVRNWIEACVAPLPGTPVFAADPTPPQFPRKRGRPRKTEARL